MTDHSTNQIHEKLSESDLELVRVLEDLIELLIEKNIISLSELPEQAVRKLLERKKMRDRLRHASPFADDHEEILL